MLQKIGFAPGINKQITATTATTVHINTPFLNKLTNQLYDKYIFLLIQFNY